VRVSGRLNLLRRGQHFRLLFLASAGSAFGTYLAAVALTLNIFALTGSGTWVAALLVADFLPIVVIGLVLGPLVDRFQRRRLMVAADLVRAAVFCALPFVNTASALVALAAVSGIATGFFRPAVYAGVPNLVSDDDDLTEANSLLIGVENLAWVVGPVLAGVIVGNAAVNVSEVVFATESLDAGSTGFGILVAASGVGLTIGSFATPIVMGSLGLHRLYVFAIALMAVGWGFAAAAPGLWVAVPLVVLATVGNAMAIVCNQVLIQRGSPDRLRGRAIAVLMSTTYATMALAMAAAGLLVNEFGGRVVWALAGGVYVLGAIVAVAMMRRLPVSATDRPPEPEPLGPDGSHIVERIKTAVGS